MSRARLIKAAETLARTWQRDEHEQVAALRQDGFSEDEAHRLIALLPLAFSRPILEEMGVRHFVAEVSAQAADGTFISATLTRQPEYSAALKLARAHRKRGVMTHEVYTLIAGSSAEIDAVSNALNQGADISGGTVASALIGREIARYLIR